MSSHLPQAEQDALYTSGDPSAWLLLTNATYGKWDGSARCYERRWRANDQLASRGCDPADSGAYRDLAYYSRDGVKLSTAVDANANGILELHRSYDRAGKLVFECRDQDEDGFWEACTTRSRGRAMVAESFDSDGDGIPDRHLLYGRSGNLARDCRDGDADGLTEVCTVPGLCGRPCGTGRGYESSYV